MTSTDPGRMTCAARTRAGVTVLELAGEIDLTSESALNQAIAAAIAARPTAIIVDLAGVRFMDSSGVRCLIIGRRDATSAGITLTVREATGVVKHVLTITGVLPAFAAPEPAIPGVDNAAVKPVGGFLARLGRLTGSSRRTSRP